MTAVVCAVCDQPLGDVHPHYPHDEDCPQLGIGCACPTDPVHPDCCPLCSDRRRNDMNQPRTHNDDWSIQEPEVEGARFLLYRNVMVGRLYAGAPMSDMLRLLNGHPVPQPETEPDEAHATPRSDDSVPDSWPDRSIVEARPAPQPTARWTASGNGVGRGAVKPGWHADILCYGEDRWDMAEQIADALNAAIPDTEDR